MTHQSEQVLEDNLIKQLVSMGYEQVALTDETSLLTNLQEQLWIHNRSRFSTRVCCSRCLYKKLSELGFIGLRDYGIMLELEFVRLRD